MTKGEFTPVAVEEGEKPRKSGAKRCIIIAVVVVIIVIVLAAVAVGAWMYFMGGDDDGDADVFNGMDFKPRVDENSNLVKFNSSDPSSYEALVKQLVDLYSEYDDFEEDVIDCRGPNVNVTGNKVCAFRVDTVNTVCQESTGFGYEEGKPCFAVLLDKIVDWKPEPYYNNSVAPKEIDGVYNGDSIPITCEDVTEGTDGDDAQITVYPATGLPFIFYPYKEQPAYLQPFVVVQYENPTPGTLLNVTCRAWASNLEDRSVTFALTVD